MERNKFIRIFSRNTQIICCCCDTFITSEEQRCCPQHSSCGCRPLHNSERHHTIKDEYNNFDNTKDKILATLRDCYMKEEGKCHTTSCNSCNFTVAKLKYLESFH